MPAARMIAHSLLAPRKIGLTGNCFLQRARQSLVAPGNVCQKCLVFHHFLVDAERSPIPTKGEQLTLNQRVQGSKSLCAHQLDQMLIGKDGPSSCPWKLLG